MDISGLDLASLDLSLTDYYLALSLGCAVGVFIAAVLSLWHPK